MKTSAFCFSILLAISPLASAQVSAPPPEEELSVYLPLIGAYGPNPRIHHFAGDIFRFDGRSFHYRYFTDVANDKSPEVIHGVDGEVRYFPSYIELSFPSGKRIHFIRSRVLNRTVLIPWAEYQKLSQDGGLDENKLLYQEFRK